MTEERHFSERYYWDFQFKALIFRSKINDSAIFRQKYRQSIINRFFQKENDMF